MKSMNVQERCDVSRIWFWLEREWSLQYHGGINQVGSDSNMGALPNPEYRPDLNIRHLKECLDAMGSTRATLSSHDWLLLDVDERWLNFWLVLDSVTKIVGGISQPPLCCWCWGRKQIQCLTLGWTSVWLAMPKNSVEATAFEVTLNRHYLWMDNLKLILLHCSFCLFRQWLSSCLRACQMRL